MKTPIKFKFYADAGHGWLAVKRDLLIKLEILDKITHYSYQRGKTVYLEEDCDMPLFLQKLTKDGMTFRMSSSVANNSNLFSKQDDNEAVIVIYNVGDVSPIRSYESLDEALSLANEEVMRENTIKAKIFNDERLIREIEGTF